MIGRVKLVLRRDMAPETSEEIGIVARHVVPVFRPVPFSVALVQVTRAQLISVVVNWEISLFISIPIPNKIISLRSDYPKPQKSQSSDLRTPRIFNSFGGIFDNTGWLIWKKIRIFLFNSSLNKKLTFEIVKFNYLAIHKKPMVFKQNLNALIGAYICFWYLERYLVRD